MLTEQERSALDTYKSEVGAFANQRLLGNKSFVKKLITTEPSAAEKLIGKLREIRENLSARKDPKTKAQLDFTRKAEKLFMQALSEAGGVIDATGKIHIANREDDELTRENGERMQVRRLAKKRISQAVDDAIANKGKIGEKYDQVKISEVPSNVANLVSRASAGLIDISNKMVAVNGNEVWHEYERHSKVDAEQSRQQIAFTPADMKDAIEAIYDPDVVESVFADPNNPTQRQSFAYAKKSPNGHYVVVEAVGGKRNPNIVPVMILQFSETKWGKMIADGKTLGELFFENDPVKLNALNIEFNKKNRVTAAQFASNEAIANTPRSPQSTISISNSDQIVNPSTQENSDKVSRSRAATGEVVTLTKGEMAKLHANYAGDKVFDKGAVTNALKGIDALKVLPAARRRELATEIWTGYNKRLHSQGFELFTEIKWNQLHAEILQESGFDMTEDEIAAMDEQIVAALREIVASGKPSIKARLESDTSTEGYRRQAEFWRGEHTKTVEHHKRLNSLKYELEKLANQKKGRYVSAANYRGNSFKVAIDELARMNWRGGLVSATKIREHFAALAAWYTKENPLYKGDGGTNALFRQEIADALASLGNSQNGALTNEDLMAAETVVKYFAHEIEAHDTYFKDGKRLDATPAAKDYIEKARRAKEIAVKCGVWRGLMQSRFARLVADPAMLMRQADGYLSGFFTEQYEALRQGTIDASVKERELLEEFEKFFEEHKAYGKRYNDATVTFGDAELPLQEAISLYMTMHREHAFAGLAGAGFEIDGKDATENVSDGFAKEVQDQIAEDLRGLPPEELLTLTKKKNAELERAALAKVMEKKRTALYEQFTAEDKALIEIMERAFEKCREIKVRIDEIVQGYSNVTGGYYYPIRRTGLAENVDAYTGFEGDRVSNLSMNKETVKNAHKLYIEPAHIVFMRHLKATALYHGLGVFTDNFNRLYNLDITRAVTVRETATGTRRFFEEYSEQQKNNWANSKRIVICESDQQYRAFIKDARDEGQNNRKMYFGIVSGSMADQIKNATGIDVRGFNCSLSAYEIKKIFKDHGSEAREAPRGQRAMTEQDVFLIPEVMGAFDSVSQSSKDYNGKPVITFEKSYRRRKTYSICGCI